MAPRPFQIKVPDEALRDLYRRLDATIWPDEGTGAGWTHGTSRPYLKELAHYWRHEFDWRAVESRLNSFSHFIADVQGLGIHFIHQKGHGPNPVPLIISHGWPSSFAEMQKIIPLLTDPAGHGGHADDAFDVVVPSLPGFIFSETSPEGGMHLARMADISDELMTALGYQRYAAQGGDIGSGVTAALGLRHADHVIGVHVTSAALVTPWLDESAPPLSPAESAYLEGRRNWMSSEGAYYMLQSTKPQTLSFGLTDSPVGLAAWIVEKFRAWSDCHGDIESRFTKDELLTNISLYWFTRSIGSANRFYYENRTNPLALGKDERIEVRTGLSVFPADISLPPREWAERSFQVEHYQDMPRGGHFNAMEEPELLVEEIRSLFRADRTSLRHAV
ncbi:pimeloyl-ACP methyl ester carboxylesterase [Pseudarthrobacter defluvii]|uniref:Pimeloyl-ACP methyl ester carboxylesterase n=1 Tax=Pseudarthrobacter defluvii TaxID=410837 RepID=A0ABT9UPC5_9MICC|nr:epoxide hydrolase family protein [Pseudarthrobacter defluvii]MDQ0120833.1 pimeloyl-ACP methyl ester carboxylesterase [Pseudarthrobacter defluvii]